jgi:hypothetical protein
VIALDLLDSHRWGLATTDPRSPPSRESQVCAGKKVTCPDGCGEVIAQGLLLAHHEVSAAHGQSAGDPGFSQVCPKASIPCSNGGFGCKWAGGRLQLEEHVQDCWFEKSKDFMNVYQEEMNRIRTEMAEVVSVS